MKGSTAATGSGDGGKEGCWFVGTRVSWSLYIEVDYVDVKVQRRGFKRSKLLYTVFVFHVRVYFVVNLLTIHVARSRRVASFSSRSHECKNESRLKADCDAFLLVDVACSCFSPKTF